MLLAFSSIHHGQLISANQLRLCVERPAKTKYQRVIKCLGVLYFQPIAGMQGVDVVLSYLANPMSLMPEMKINSTLAKVKK